MKQKKIGDILYVFDQTPYVITQDTDAEVIKIQLEAVDGFKAINNSTINAKIEGYNYFLFTVHKQEWADYVDNYTITVASTTHGTCAVDKTDADPGEEITITVTPAAGYELDTLTVMAGETPVTVTNSKFTMPAANVTVTATFAQSGVTFNGKFYDYADQEITQPWSVNISSADPIFKLMDDSTGNPVYATTSDKVSQVGRACIVATFESSDTSVVSIDEAQSGPMFGAVLNSAGTANIIVTWPAQTVEDPSTHEETYYAGGTQTLQITVVG